jgi:hypothetical protein
MVALKISRHSEPRPSVQTDTLPTEPTSLVSSTCRNLKLITIFTGLCPEQQKIESTSQHFVSFKCLFCLSILYWLKSHFTIMINRERNKTLFFSQNLFLRINNFKTLITYVEISKASCLNPWAVAPCFGHGVSPSLGWSWQVGMVCLNALRKLRCSGSRQQR